MTAPTLKKGGSVRKSCFLARRRNFVITTSTSVPQDDKHPCEAHARVRNPKHNNNKGPPI